MSDIIYCGPFKEHIKNYIELKKSIGYKFISEAMHLKRFDLFTLEKYSSAKTLDKEIVLAWCNKKIYEEQANQSSRASIIRQFCIYLQNIGVRAYILPKGYYPKGKKYMPYIYTVQELNRFFNETDKCHYTSEAPWRHLIMPVLFRMIYTCGLRVSEARLLKVKDVDLENGILSINNSKNNKSRLVPMSDSLNEKCIKYSNEVHCNSKPDDTYFPALDGKPMTIENLYKNFRKFLWKAKISHGGRGQGPRIHDFRHSFCVHCLKKWSQQGKDLMVYLPILRTYLGHDTFSETAYYLRLTADVFPDITIRLEDLYPDLIPMLEDSRFFIENDKKPRPTGDCHETN